MSKKFYFILLFIIVFFLLFFGGNNHSKAFSVGGNFTSNEKCDYNFDKITNDNVVNDSNVTAVADLDFNIDDYKSITIWGNFSTDYFSTTNGATTFSIYHYFLNDDYDYCAIALLTDCDNFGYLSYDKGNISFIDNNAQGHTFTNFDNGIWLLGFHNDSQFNKIRVLVYSAKLKKWVIDKGASVYLQNFNNYVTTGHDGFKFVPLNYVSYMYNIKTNYYKASNVDIYRYVRDGFWGYSNPNLKFSSISNSNFTTDTGKYKIYFSHYFREIPGGDFPQDSTGSGDSNVEKPITNADINNSINSSTQSIVDSNNKTRESINNSINSSTQSIVDSNNKTQQSINNMNNSITDSNVSDNSITLDQVQDNSKDNTLNLFQIWDIINHSFRKVDNTDKSFTFNYIGGVYTITLHPNLLRDNFFNKDKGFFTFYQSFFWVVFGGAVAFDLKNAFEKVKEGGFDNLFGTMNSEDKVVKSALL